MTDEPLVALRDALAGAADAPARTAAVTALLRDGGALAGLARWGKDDPGGLEAAILDVAGVPRCGHFAVQLRTALRKVAKGLRRARPVAAAPQGAQAAPVLDGVVGLAVERPETDVYRLLELTRGTEDEPGHPTPSPSNVHYVLSQDSRWCGRIRANDFDGNLYLSADAGQPGRRTTDQDLTDIVHWLERVYSLKTNEERVARTMVVCGSEHAYHPVRDWLDVLRWDGEPRLDRLLDFYLGATAGEEDGPSTDLLAALGRCWMVSCVARVMQPGCKVDTTLILVGAQGALKSTACRALANGWFSDAFLDLHSKDFYESIQGVWLYELAELDALNRADWSRIKAILSSPVDRWRRPYGRSVEARPRQVVFLGTTNRDDFLGDPTGSRRFWPVRVGAINLERLQEDAGQLWAEAVALYRLGARWWLDRDLGDELAEISAEFAAPSAWMSTIATWLQSQMGREVTTAEVLTGAIKKDIAQWTRNDEAEVGGVLRRLGYRPVRRRQSGVKVRSWTREP